MAGRIRLPVFYLDTGVIMSDVTYEFSHAYRVKLANFDGPLDLLLHVIKEAKLSIRDVFLSQITEQYMAYLDEIGTLDLEKASEFIEVAATLIEIKSKALLPKIEELMSEEEDAGDKLIRQLEEYQMFKEVTEKIKELENVNRFYKTPDQSVSDYKIVLKQMTLDGLLDAFSRLLTKVETKKISPPARQIKKDPFTVANKIEHIINELLRRKQVSFFELFASDYTKSEVITTFQALLELLKMQLIKAEQSGVFEDISITVNENFEQNIETRLKEVEEEERNRTDKHKSGAADGN